METSIHPSQTRPEVLESSNILVDRSEAPALDERSLKDVKREVLKENAVRTLKNPLTLVLFTWFVMAILLWWEIATAAK